MNQVSVVIPSWNGRHLLPYCLQALKAQTTSPAEIIIVDNGSVDDTAAWLASSWPRIRCIPLKRNTGFAAAVNTGVAAAHGEYVLVLNNDAALYPNYIAGLCALMNQNPGAAAVQGRVLCHEDPTQVDSLGIELDAHWRAFQIAHGEPDPGDDGRRQIPGVTACAALYRRTALLQVADPGSPPAIFDPSFFAYFEDVDLSLRLNALGWESWLEPAVACEHVGSATGGRDSMGKAFLLGRNYLLYLARHLTAGAMARLLPGLLGLRFRRLLTWPFHPRRDTALWAGECAALPRLPAAFRKGRQGRRRHVRDAAKGSPAS